MTPDESDKLRRDLVTQTAIADALVIEAAQRIIEVAHLKHRIAELERENAMLAKSHEHLHGYAANLPRSEKAS